MRPPPLARRLALRATECAALLRAWALLLVVEVGLRVGLRRPLMRRLERRTLVVVAPPSLPRLVRLVDLAARAAPFRATCLSKALVMGWLLARAGVPVRLRFGVARRAGRLEAHAWLESGGVAIFGLEPSDPYVPLRAVVR